jgi:hypothetical protein
MKNYQPMKATDSRSAGDNQSITKNSNTDDDDSSQEETGYDN